MRPHLLQASGLDVITPAVSLFAFDALRSDLARVNGRFVLPSDGTPLALLGASDDRASRNRLRMRWLANCFAEWADARLELRRAWGPIPQGALVVRGISGEPEQAILGAFAFTTDGLGITPGNPLSLIQVSQSPEESELFAA